MAGKIVKRVGWGENLNCHGAKENGRESGIEKKKGGEEGKIKKLRQRGGGGRNRAYKFHKTYRESSFQE